MKMPMPFASMRMTRTSVPPLPPMQDEVPQTMSDPMDLERNYSDDSSVFSGLAEEASHHHDLDDEGDYYEDDLIDCHEDSRLVVTQSSGTGSQLSSSDDDIIHHRRHYESSSQLTSSHLAPTRKGILRGSLSGPYISQPTYSSSKMGGGTSTEEESDAYSSEFPSDAPTESTLTDRSHRSRLREMPPMVDSDTAFGMSSTLSSSQPPGTRGAIGEAESGSRCSQAPDTSNPNPWLHHIGEGNENNPELFPDSDTNTQMTWGSANDVPRPKGTVKLVSQVSFLGDMKAGKKQVRLAVGNSDHPHYHETQQEGRNPLEECPTDDSGSRIVDMLNDFEKQMDENLKSIQDEDETNDTSDDNAQVGGVLSELQDMPPRQVRSEEDTSSTVLTPHKARKLQRILHKARKEVEVLRDNNEQFKSEIEQMEEEHKSELKLIEDRTKQKLGELRYMYQEEIDKLVLEKDAAVVEAGRQAARYAESGKKQVLSLKKQLERLTSTATATIKEKVGEAGRTALAHKDKEITARLRALRTSYENELEKIRKDCDGRVKSEVERAVSSVAQRVRLNQDVLISELREQIDSLRIERRTFETVLKAVKGNFDKHYPDEMKLYAKRSEDFAGSARKLLDEGASPKDGSEKDLKDVVEIFAFLLQCKEKKVVSAQYMTEIEETKRERNEVYSQMRKELLLRHRAEIDHLRKERDEAAEKLKVVEANFKNMGREKRFLEEKHRRAMENHRKQVERLESEKEAALEIEKSRKDLAVAMAAGQRHIKNASLRSQDEMKSNNERPTQSAIGLQPSESTEESAIPVPPTRPSISTDHQKYAFESASIRKARTFLTQISPRESPRFSPAHSQHRLSFGDFEKKQSLPGDSPIKSYDLLVPTKKASEIDCEAKKSVLASKENANLSDAQFISETQKLVVPDPDEERPPHPRSKLEPNPISEARDAVDPLPDIKKSNSNTSNSSDRSKDTILSNLRNQAKKAKKEKAGDSLVNKEPSGNLPEGEPSARKKSFAILRTFKNKKEGHRRDPSLDNSSCLVSQVDKKEDSSNLMSRSIRRARMIKNLFDANSGKVDDDRYSRGSLDHSISSLQTNTGTDGIVDDYQVEKSNEDGRVLDARQSKVFLEARNTESVKQSSEEYSSKVPQRCQNTLGMFVHAKHLKETDNRVGSLPTMSSDIDSNLGMEPATITESSTQTDRCSDEKKNFHQLRESGASISVTKTNASVHFKESSAAHLNLKKPNLDGFHDSKDMIASTASRINAKKRVSVQSGVPKVDSIFTIRNPSSESYNENAIPKTISVTSPTKRSSNATFATVSSTYGHTLLAKPPNARRNSKNCHHPGMVASNLSASTSPTALTSEEDGLLYDSQAQMRKYPPLTDDEVSEDEDESLSNSLDRYQTMESPPKKNSEHFDDFNDIPLVASRSVDAEPEDVRESIVVQGQPIGIGGGTRGTRNTTTALASFRNGYLKGKDAQESTSQTGSTVSEATTAITAHTRSVTFSGSTSRRTGTMSTTLPLSSHHHGGSSHSRTSHTGTSGRFAALKARVRVRREAMQEGN